MTAKRFLLLLVIFLSLLGIFFRLSNLDLKFPWMDECITQVRISDYSFSATENFRDTQINPVRVATLKSLMEERPRQSLVQYFQSKLSKAPEHPPLYYLFAEGTAQLTSNKLENLRRLSAYISLLTFPGMYWLCLKLFGSNVYGLVGIGITAISPIYLLYSQEARQYSLWIVVGIFSSAALSNALTRRNRKSWILYSLTLIVGTYSHLFFFFNILSHASYILLLFIFKDKSLKRNTLSNYLTSLCFAVFCFLPWMTLFFHKESKADDQLKIFGNSFDMLSIFKRFIGSTIRVFFDTGSDEKIVFNIGSILSFFLPSLLILTIISYSIFYIVRLAKAHVHLHVLTLIFVSPVIILVADMVTGKTLSQSRYLMPVYLGVQLAVIYFIGNQISQFLRKSAINSVLSKLFVISIFSLIIGGMVSCTFISYSSFWWNKGSAQNLSHFAQLIDEKNSLLLTDVNFLPRIMSLAYQLGPEVLLQFTPNIVKSNYPGTVESIYFLGNADNFSKANASEFSLLPLSEIPEINLHLYKVLMSN